jgi:MarR family transcriptional regulator for hemolysin
VPEDKADEYPVWNRDSVGRLLTMTAREARAHLDQRLATAGASFATWRALSSLRHSGPVSQRELATQLGIEGPTMTSQLTRMTQDGLVERTRSALDGRVMLVELTPRGQRLYQQLVAIVSDAHELLLDGFSPAETDMLRAQLERIRRNCRHAQADFRRTLLDET